MIQNQIVKITHSHHCYFPTDLKNIKIKTLIMRKKQESEGVYSFEM